MAADAGVTAATAAATGVISIPVLAAMGIDPSAMVAGLIGCTIGQTLIPSLEARSWQSIALLTLGSVLFASLMTPLLAPWVFSKASQFVTVHQDHARAVTAGALGLFAQPAVMLIRAIVASRLKMASKAAKGGDA